MGTDLLFGSPPLSAPPFFTMNRLRISNATFLPTLSLVTFSFIFFDASVFPLFIRFPQLHFPPRFLQPCPAKPGGRKGGGGKKRAAGQAWLSPVLNYSSTISLLLPGLRGAEVRRGSFPLGYELFGQIFVV